MRLVAAATAHAPAEWAYESAREWFDDSGESVPLTYLGMTLEVSRDRITWAPDSAGPPNDYMKWQRQGVAFAAFVIREPDAFGEAIATGSDMTEPGVFGECLGLDSSEAEAIREAAIEYARTTGAWRD